MRASRVMRARRLGTCALCHAGVTVGQQIGRTPIGWCHTQCIIERALGVATSKTTKQAR
jgi:hypothetical protein